MMGRYWIVLAAAAISGCNLSPPSPDQERERKAANDERIATLINLNGHLCAKVVFIGPRIDGGDYQVNCEEYRDSRKATTKHNLIVYLVNPDVGTVRLVGRGR